MQLSQRWPHQAVCVVFKQRQINKFLHDCLTNWIKFLEKNEDKLCYFDKADVSSGCHCLGTNAFYSSCPNHCNDMSNKISFEEQSDALMRIASKADMKWNVTMCVKDVTLFIINV